MAKSSKTNSAAEPVKKRASAVKPAAAKAPKPAKVVKAAVAENPAPAENTGSSPAPNPEFNNDGFNAHVVVVIPYKKDAAQGDELLYALRAWDKNLPGCKVVVIGDAEPYFSAQVLHIAHIASSDNPQVDVLNKLLIAISDADIPDEFIWSNDDIYPVTPLHLADLMLLTSNGTLGQTKSGVKGTYLANLQRTIKLLKTSGLNQYDYSTHTPFHFNKESLSEVIASLPDDEGYLLSSVYYNTVYPTVVPLKVDGGRNDSYVACVYRDNPDMEILSQAFTSRKFVNHNNKGYKPVLALLKKCFPDKSRFEI